VHRQCLNKWRTIGEDRAFSNCTECLQTYEIVRKSNDERASAFRRQRYIYYVAKDCVLSLVGIVLSVAIIAIALFTIDRRWNFFLLNTCHLIKNMPVFYSLFGLFVGLSIIGFVSMIMLCVHSADTPSGWCDCCLYSQHGYLYPHYYSQQQPVCCICPDSSFCCRDCHCRCADNECGKEGLVILIVVAVIFALVGLVVSVFLGAIHLRNVFARHLHVLEKRTEAEDHIVLDLEPDGRVELDSTVSYTNPLFLGSLNGGVSTNEDGIHGLKIGSREKVYQV